MLRLITYLTLLRQDRSGATAIEYSLLAALIAVAIIVVVLPAPRPGAWQGFLGDQIVEVFGEACAALNDDVPCN